MTTKPLRVRATFVIRGLLTPEDALQLERLLEECKGVLFAEVHFNSQKIKIEFDENIVAVQTVTRLISEQKSSDCTESLVASIFLKVPAIRNEEMARLPIHILQKVRGVERVMPHPSRQAVELRLSLDGELTTQDLIRALAVEGIAANVF